MVLLPTRAVLSSQVVIPTSQGGDPVRREWFSDEFIRTQLLTGAFYAGLLDGLLGVAGTMTLLVIY